MNKQKLVEAITNASRALKGVRSEADMVSISVKNKVMEVCGASPNLRVWATTDTDSANFECSVKASLILAALGKLTDDIKMESTKSGLILKSGTARVVLPVSEFKASDLDIRNIAYSSQIETNGLAPYVDQVIHALEVGGLNPLMNAVHLEVFEGGGFKVTALDGRRYAIRNTAAKDAKLSADFVIFGHALSEALKMLGNGDITIYKPASGNFVRMCGEGLEIAISLIEGQYFNVSSLRDRTLSVHMTVKKSEMERAVSLVKIMSRSVFVDIDETGILVFGRDSGGETETKVAAHIKGLNNGQVIKAAFNADFLLDALRSINSDEIQIHIRDGNGQCCMTDGRYAVEAVLPVRRAN